MVIDTSSNPKKNKRVESSKAEGGYNYDDEEMKLMKEGEMMD